MGSVAFGRDGEALLSEALAEVPSRWWASVVKSPPIAQHPKPHVSSFATVACYNRPVTSWAVRHVGHLVRPNGTCRRGLQMARAAPDRCQHRIGRMPDSFP